MSSGLARQFLQFAIVGGLGTVTNLAIFFVSVDLLDFPALGGATVAFAVAVTQNYVLNEAWTFQRGGKRQLAGRRFGKFVFFSLLALGINLAVLQWLIQNYTFPLLVIPQAVGIGAATLFNFGASRLVTFR